MKSTVVKRSIVVAGHKTSVSLEDAFWKGLKDIAKARRVTLSDLVGGIDTDREHGNLSSALRLFVLDHYQKRAASGMVVDTLSEPPHIPTCTIPTTGLTNGGFSGCAATLFRSVPRKKPANRYYSPNAAFGTS